MLRTPFRTGLVLALAAAFAGVPTAQAAPGTLRVAAGLFQPAQAAPLQLDDTELRASTRRDGDAVLLRLEAAGTPARSLALPDELQQVTALRRHGDRLVVTGWMNSALASLVLVVDWRQAQVIDQFWAYAPSISPDGSLIAFERFYPSHGVQGEESQYRFYRTAESPQANRPALAPNGSASRDVGLAAWPADLAAGPRPNTGVPAARAHHRLSPLAWSADSTRFAVVDAQGSAAQVLLFTPNASPLARSHPIASPEALCLPVRATPRGCAAVPTEAVSLRHAADAVELSVHAGGGRAKPRSLSLPLAAFSAASDR
ncbi:MAG TPA: hypothetical protein VFY73_28100 [Ideonella sp.]|uniref:hypothetical protein n=1 Tax=Ideonella sp. TaxID=1929293 RepID=UPI002E3517FC|nr:hypothetical protein [Ideonella sp.]HEX5687897.1 hypothetical protein [Ideonella sp.]